MTLATKSFWICLPLATGLVTPSAIIFCLEVFVGRVSPIAAIQDIGLRQFAEGHNLFLLAVVGLIPFALLSVILLVIGRHLSASRLAYCHWRSDRHSGIYDPVACRHLVSSLRWRPHVIHGGDRFPLYPLLLPCDPCRGRADWLGDFLPVTSKVYS